MFIDWFTPSHHHHWLAVILDLGPCRRARSVHIKSFYRCPTIPGLLLPLSINQDLWAEYLMKRANILPNVQGLGNQKGHAVCKRYSRPWGSPSQGGSLCSVIYNSAGLTDPPGTFPSTNPKPLTACAIQTGTNYGLNEAEELLQITGRDLWCLHYLLRGF